MTDLATHNFRGSWPCEIPPFMQKNIHYKFNGDFIGGMVVIDYIAH